MRGLTMKLTRRMMMGVAMGGYLLSAGAAMAKTDLTFWSWRTEDKAFYNDVIKKFQEKEPDISVKFETYAPENYQTILSTALAAGRGPDVIQARAYGNLETIAAPGYLLALDTTSVPELANFPEAALAAETLRSDGKVYAVPFATQAQLIVYNKTIFADPRFVNALTKLKDISQYFSPNFTGVDYPSSQQLFVAGRGAMFVGG